MDYHLDRRVILNDDPKYLSLYKWSLQELGDDGKQIGHDLIPWWYSLDFVAFELSLSDKLNIKPDYKEPQDSQRTGVRREQSIIGKLRPNPLGPNRQTSYSMLGTNRRISDFYLRIEALPEGETVPTCSVWGSLAFTAETDFRNEEFQDSLSFTLRVTSAQLAEYVARITNSTLDLLSLSISGVQGFYSEWSPSISTNAIKVLTSDDEHTVEIPAGWAFPPPRLGEVMEANVSFHVTKTLDTSFLDDGGADAVGRAEAPAGPAPPVPQTPAIADPKLVKHISSIRLAAWVIAVLLLVLTLKS